MRRTVTRALDLLNFIRRAHAPILPPLGRKMPPGTPSGRTGYVLVIPLREERQRVSTKAAYIHRYIRLIIIYEIHLND